MVEQVVGLEFVTAGYDQANLEIRDYTKSLARALVATKKAANGANHAASEYLKTASAYAKATASISTLNSMMAKNAREAQAIVNAAAGVTNEYKSAAESADVFAQQIARVDAANLKVAQAFGDAARAALQYNTANKSAAESASVFASELATGDRVMRQQAKAFGEAVVSANTYAKSNKSAADSASVFIAELRKQETQASKVAAANQAHMRELQQANLANKSAADSAAVFAKEIDRQERATIKASQAFGESARAALQYKLANKSAADSASVFAKEIERQERAAAQAAAEQTAERIRLEAMYNRTATAARIYEQAVTSLNRAEQLGVITADQKQKELAQLDAAYAQVGQSASRTSTFINQYGEGARVAGISTNKFGMYAQQVGYQVGDFFVQIQSGTNAFVAFGQQATQLAGLLPGLAGAIVGIGISVATTFLAAWSRTSAELDRTTQSVKRLEEGLKSLDGTVQDWLRTKKASELGITVEELTGVEGIEQAEKAVADAMKGVERVRALMMSPGSAYGAQGLFLAQAFGILESEKDVKAAESTLVAAQNRLNLLRQKQAEERRVEFLEENRTLEQQLGIRERILRFGEDSLEVLREQTQIEKANYAQRLAALDLTDRQKIDLIETNNAVQDIALSQEVLNRGVSAAHSLWQNIANEALANIEEKNKENIEAQKRGFEIVRNLKNELQDAAKTNLAKVFTDASGPAQRLLGQASALFATLQQRQAEIEYAKRVGGGRGLGPQGPTTEELARNVPEVQLALARQEAQRRAEEEAARAGRGSGGGGGATAANAVQQLDQQIERTRVLLTLNSQQADVQREVWRIVDALGEDANKYSNDFIANKVRENMAIQEQLQAMQDAYAQQQGIYDQMQSSMEDAFMSIVDGTASAKDAFRSMAYEVIKELYRVLVVQRLVGSFNATDPTKSSGLVGAIGRWFANANGNAFSGGSVIPFANGGVVGGPTTFPMSGGRTGLMGEAGPEAIMPLKRGRDGKLGVVAEGGGSVNIVQNFNIAANGDESVKRIVMEQAPAIANMTKAAVIDSRRRGGQMKAAFR